MDFISRRTRIRSASALPWVAMIAMAAMWPRDRKKPAPSLSEPEKTAPERFETEQPGRGRLADQPQRIPWRGWKDVLWRTFKEIGADRLSIVAGGVTFYTLLAIFPTLTAFVSLYGLVADINVVLDQITTLARLLPPGVVDLLGDQMIRLATAHDAGLSVAFLFSLVLAIWSANAGMNALFDGMNIAYGEAEKRGFFRRKLITLGFTAGAIAILTVLAVLLIAVPLWIDNAIGLAPSDLWWVPFRWVAILAMMMAAFIVLYRFGPSRSEARWSWAWIGAVFAAVAWLIGSMAFSFYLDRFAHYENAYGPLGTVIGFMVWIWFSAMVVLLGAELNAEIEHQTAIDTTTGAPAPLGARGAKMADTVGLAFTGFNAAKVKGKEKAVWSKLRSASPPPPKAGV
jgi:membrane protein